MLSFNKDGLLVFHHNCEACLIYPPNNDDEPCIMCGYTKKELNEIEEHCSRFNKAYENYYNSLES